MIIRRAAPLNCARVCFQTVLNSAVTFNSIPKLSTTQVIGELLVAESQNPSQWADAVVCNQGLGVWKRGGDAGRGYGLGLFEALGDGQVQFEKLGQQVL